MRPRICSNGQFPSGHSTTDTLISAVQTAFHDVSSTSLLRNFVTLKEVLKCVLSNGGGNDFKIPHVKKIQRMRAGEDITEVSCTRAIINQAASFLATPEPSKDASTS